MIRRCVFFRFEEAFQSAEANAEIVAHTCTVFRQIESVLSFEVGRPADAHADAAWDVMIVATFKDEVALAAYAIDLGHRAYVDDFIRPKLKVRKAWNFVVQEPMEGTS